MSSKKYGLIIPKASNHRKNQLGKAASIFGNASSEEDENKKKSVINQELNMVAEKKKQTKQTKGEIEKALKEDPSVYKYDEIYEELEDNKIKIGLQNADKNKKPKYITSLLKSAASRQQEHERRIERKVEKERANEGDEFADKESFVTSAYRKKMIERAEEEERLKKQDAIDAANDVTKQKDLSQFYRHLLDSNVAMGADSGSQQQDTETEKLEEAKQNDIEERENEDANKEAKAKKSNEYQSKSGKRDKYDKGRDRRDEIGDKYMKSRTDAREEFHGKSASTTGRDELRKTSKKMTSSSSESDNSSKPMHRYTSKKKKYRKKRSSNSESDDRKAKDFNRKKVVRAENRRKNKEVKYSNDSDTDHEVRERNIDFKIKERKRHAIERDERSLSSRAKESSQRDKHTKLESDRNNRNLKRKRKSKSHVTSTSNTEDDESDTVRSREGQRGRSRTDNKYRHERSDDIKNAKRRASPKSSSDSGGYQRGNSREVSGKGFKDGRSDESIRRRSKTAKIGDDEGEANRVSYARGDDVKMKKADKKLATRTIENEKDEGLNVFAKRNDTDSTLLARQRYIARKKAKQVNSVIEEDSD